MTSETERTQDPERTAVVEDPFAPAPPADAPPAPPVTDDPDAVKLPEGSSEPIVRGSDELPPDSEGEDPTKVPGPVMTDEVVRVSEPTPATGTTTGGVPTLVDTQGPPAVVEGPPGVPFEEAPNQLRTSADAIAQVPEESKDEAAAVAGRVYTEEDRARLAEQLGRPVHPQLLEVRIRPRAQDVVGYYSIPWQNGPRGENGVNGIVLEDILPGIIEYAKAVNGFPFDTPWGSETVEHLEAALAAQIERRASREEREVEGTSQP